MKNDGNLQKYERMRKVGATPEIVYRVTKLDGFKPTQSLKILLTLFPKLSLTDAKQVMILCDTGLSLFDHQAKLLPDIEEALRASNEEN